MVEDVGAAEEHRRRAQEFERDGSYSEAVAAYREAIRLDPTDASTHVRLGVALRSAGQDEEANRAFHTALTLRAAGAPDAHAAL